MAASPATGTWRAIRRWPVAAQVLVSVWLLSLAAAAGLSASQVGHARHGGRHPSTTVVAPSPGAPR